MPSTTAHGEHDDAEQVRHARRERLEGARQEETGDAGRHHEERENGDRNAGDLRLGGEGGIDRGVRVSAGFWGFGCLKHPSMVPSVSAMRPLYDQGADEYVRFMAPGSRLRRFAGPASR